MSDVRTLTVQLNKLPAIRIQGILKKRSETLQLFLVRFFTRWNHENDTIFVDTHKVQTAAGKRRSISDIYKICKYYYPACTLRQVKEMLYGGLTGDDIPRFRTSYCHTINKRVWYQGSSDQASSVYDKTTKDEFGMTYKEWVEL
jgi:hypothetical protein